jgi:hypothetical protein
MGDDLIPEAEPNNRSDEASPDKRAGDERPQNTEKNIPASHGDVVAEPKSTLIVNAILFGVIESAAFVLWQIADGLTGHICVFVHWLSLVCISAGAFPATRTATTSKGRVWLSTAYAIIWVLLAVVAYVIWHPKKPEPKPHFTLSLQIDGSPGTVVLTNEYFFQSGMVNVIHSSNGFLLFNGIANGCVVIPVQPRESNKVFNFIAENDSPVKVTDLQLAVGFPKDWELGFDSTKWHAAGEHYTIPGWKLQITNLQFWGAQSPFPLFPNDSVWFPPITNSSIYEFNSPSNKTGLFRLCVRSTGFLSEPAANILFVRTSSSNSFKPFVTGLNRGTDGVWRISMSRKELEDSQK